MERKIFSIALLFIGLTGILSVGVVKADTPDIRHYTDSNISYRLNSGTNAAVEFTGVGTITITSGTDTITILDRNLGATEAGTGCENQSWPNVCEGGDSTYGYHFQWGNNYGFPANLELPSNQKNNSQVDSSFVNVGYMSGIFYYGYENWINNNSKTDMWGGSEFDYISEINGNNWKINNAENRRGPCPEGFHVPSYGEFAKLFNMMNQDSNLIHSGLMIPFAGSRNSDNALPGSDLFGTMAFLWTSSPYSNSDSTSRLFYVNSFYYLDGVDYMRAFGMPIRCFYDDYDIYKLNIKFMSGNMEVWSGKVVSGALYTGDIPDIESVDPIPNMEKEGYSFDGWFLDGETEAFNLEERTITQDTILHAQWTKIYTIMWVDGDGNTLKTDQVRRGDMPSYTGDTPTKMATSDYTYTFNGIWLPEVVVATEDTGYVAQFDAVAIKKKSSGYSGRGRRLRNSSSEDSQHFSAESQNEDKTSSGMNANNFEQDMQDSLVKASESGKYAQEFLDAYQFAHKNRITTMDTIDNADMEGGLTRIAMSKMLSQYAINILGKVADTTETCIFNDVPKELDEEYGNGVTLACQLGIMGINMQDYNFRPFDNVTRAEFGTALSRMLYGTTDGEELYYLPHLVKLLEKKIISNANPDLQELRGYVMIMLMRSAM